MSKDQSPIILAFSGGLDTSFCVPWLKEHYGRDVITACVDTGGIETALSNRAQAELCYDGPSGLSVTFGNGTNEMSWSEGEGPIDYYVVRRGNKEAAPDSIGSVPAGATSFIDDTSDDCPRDDYN